MTAKPKVKRDFFSVISLPPNSQVQLEPYWHWSHDTDECFDIVSSDTLYDTMQQAFRAAHYHLRNECETNV